MPKDRFPCHPDDFAQMSKERHHSLTTGEDCAVEFRLKKHDGAWRWYVLFQSMPKLGSQRHVLVADLRAFFPSLHLRVVLGAWISAGEQGADLETFTGCSVERRHYEINMGRP